MIVACPGCETKFNVPDDKYAPGRKARCSSCGNVFALPEIDDSVAPQTPFVEQAAPDAPDEKFPAMPEEGYFQEPDDVVLPTAGGAPSRGRKIKKLLAVLGIVCLATLLGYGGYKVFSSFRGGKQTTAPAGPTAAELAQQELAERLALKNVRQYMVTNNDKAGRMMVVEGKVINNFTVPKDLIKLEVTLYDDKGKALAVKEQYCGITLSLFQLQILSKKELEDALNNRLDILSNNTNILPKKDVPFITVFFNPPETAYELGVKIVDAKDPAPKK